MSDDKTGGPAFPHPALADEGEPGMTLRDYFAGQALVGLCTGFAGSAKSAYAIADAMISERGK